MNTIRSPPQPAPLSSSNTYTTWPGGVDPTARLYNTDNQKGGRSRRTSRKASRKAQRKGSRKASRKASRKGSRKGSRKSRSSRR